MISLDWGNPASLKAGFFYNSMFSSVVKVNAICSTVTDKEQNVGIWINTIDNFYMCILLHKHVS